MLKISFYLLLIVCFLSACYDDGFDTTTEVVIIDEPEILVDANLVGEIKDLDDQRQTNCELRINGNAYQSEHGLIRLSLDMVNEIAQTIYIETDNGKDAFINMPLLRNEMNYAEIYLFPELSETALQSGNSQTIDLEAGVRLQITKEQFPEPFSSDEIKIFYRSLSDSKLANQLGNRGFDAQGIESVLDISNAINFNWHSPLTNDLQLSSTQKATLLFENIQDKEGKALFRFSEKDDYWTWVSDLSDTHEVLVEKGGFYVVARHLPAIIARSQLILDKKPVAYQSLKINTTNKALDVYTRTTDKGNWISLIPKSGSMQVQLNTICGELISEYSLASSEEDIEYGAHELMGVASSFIALTTGVMNCMGDQESESAITIESSNNSNTYLFDESNSEVWVSSCDDEISIYANNVASGATGPSIGWNSDIEDELGLLTNCDQFEDGFSFLKIRNDRKVFDSFEIEIAAGKTILKSKDNKVRFSFRGNAAGTYEESAVNIFINDNLFGEKGYYISCENSMLGCGIKECKVTHYAEMDGEWMRISFSGKMWMQTINPPIAGNYDIEGLIMVRK